MSQHPEFTLEVIRGIQYMEQLGGEDLTAEMNRVFLWAFANEMIIKGGLSVVNTPSEGPEDENPAGKLLKILLSEGILVEQDHQPATEDQPEKAMLVFSSPEFAAGVLFAFFRIESMESSEPFSIDNVTDAEEKLLSDVSDPEKLQTVFNPKSNQDDQIH